MRDRIKGGVVVVAHMSRAIGARLKVRRSGQEGDVQSMSLTQPSSFRFHRFESLLLTDSDAPQYLPVEERAERAAPYVGAQRRERLRHQHHVRFRQAGVQGEE